MVSNLEAGNNGAAVEKIRNNESQEVMVKFPKIHSRYSGSYLAASITWLSLLLSSLEADIDKGSSL